MDDKIIDPTVQGWINDNNKRALEEQQRERIRVESYIKKKKRKDKVEKAIVNLLTAAIVVGAIYIAAPLAKEAIVNEIELQKANKYMDTALDFIATDLDRAVLSDGKVVLFSTDAESLRKIADELELEFGISRDCALYCISEKYGKEAFDKVVTTYGYENSEEFLYKLYPKKIDGYKSGDYKSFENNVQVELSEKVQLIKEIIDSKHEKVRGLK